MKRNIGAILFSVILISVITFPFLWLLLGSFKTMKELFSVPIRFFPEHISLDNYIAVFKAQPFGLYLYNSIVIALLGTVAECGGFLYLGQTLEDDAETAHPMAGVLPGQGFRVGRLVRFGYAALTPQADSMLFRAGEPVPVHEFHHWDSTCNGTAFAAQKANGRHWDCGFANGHLYAGFPHLYWAGTPLPQRFVTAAAQYAQTKTGRTV